MYTTYSQHFFFCFGFLYQIVTTTTTTSILNQIYPSYFFFSYTQYILHYLLIGFIEEVFKECNDNLLNSYIYIQIVVNNSFIYFFFFATPATSRPTVQPVLCLHLVNIVNQKTAFFQQKQNITFIVGLDMNSLLNYWLLVKLQGVKVDIKRIICQPTHITKHNLEGGKKKKIILKTTHTHTQPPTNN